MTTQPAIPLLLLWCTLSTVVLGYKFYQDEIPNGGKVPHPCKPNYIWQGVGHENSGGGGVRNPFGLDFAANGYTWDSTICNKDSDGDGKTNGEELGDPNCIWTKGGVPEETSLSHPGICEPLDDPKCGEQNWVTCDMESFDCPAMEEEGVVSQELRLSENTPVPSQETTYMCMHFRLPDDQDYHIVASKPYIDNAYVMHHILVFGCTTDVPDEEFISEPRECDMGNRGGCQSGQLAGWTLGNNGRCVKENMGFKIGPNAYTVVLMEVHWNNPQGVTDYVDSSGITLYYTPNLRPYDAAILVTGQLLLEIPPATEKNTQFGFCPKECTERYPHTLYITRALLHMHYLGMSGRVEHWRDNTKLQELVNQETYDYDTPTDFFFDPPIEFLPNDEIKITCDFKSTSKDTWTYYGEGTADEMCYAFMDYYPAMNDSRVCVTWGNVPICSADEPVEGAIRECPAMEGMERAAEDAEFAKSWFLNLTNELNLWAFASQLTESCDVTGKECKDGCQAVIDNIRSQDCWNGIAGAIVEMVLNTIEDTLDLTYIPKALHSCDEDKDDNEDESNKTEVDSNETDGNDTSVGHMTLPTLWTLFVSLVLITR